MNRKLFGLVLAFTVLAASAAAQTVTGSGTAGTVPVFTGSGTSSTIGTPSSPITVTSSGNVGIGTTSPSARLDVIGGPIEIGSIDFSPNAALHINSPGYGGLNRLTQMSPTTASTWALNLMASTDANNNSQWWTWGVNNNIWTIQPNWTFSGSTGFFIDPTGKVGIGTQSPQYTLDVNGSARITGSLILPSYTDSVFHTGNTNTNLTTYFNNAASQGYPAWDTFSLGANWNDGAGTVVNNQEGTALFQMRTNYGGTNSTNGAMITLGVGSVNSSPTTMVETITTTGVGIGTTNPGANYKLDVAGQVHSSAGFVFPDGSLQTTAYTGTCGADYAESVDVTGDRTKYAPGDILVIDPDAPGSFLKSNQPYSTMVAGVYSTQPGFVGRKHPANDPASVNEIPMAMVGRVPTRVSAENGPIKIGDLLVTSSTVGYAMKGTDRSQMLGAVIGKALGSLDSGTGVIEVLITLQ